MKNECIAYIVYMHKKITITQKNKKNTVHSLYEVLHIGHVLWFASQVDTHTV
jgi:hypothetical protein